MGSGYPPPPGRPGRFGRVLDCKLVSPLIYVTALRLSSVFRDEYARPLLCPAPSLPAVDIERIPSSALHSSCLFQSTSPNAHACILHPDLLQQCDGTCTIGSPFQIICGQGQSLPGSSIVHPISSYPFYSDCPPHPGQFITSSPPGPTLLGLTAASAPSPTAASHECPGGSHQSKPVGNCVQGKAAW